MHVFFSKKEAIIFIESTKKLKTAITNKLLSKQSIPLAINDIAVSISINLGFFFIIGILFILWGYPIIIVSFLQNTV